MAFQTFRKEAYFWETLQLQRFQKLPQTEYKYFGSLLLLEINLHEVLPGELYGAGAQIRLGT